jgi:ATP-dependent DNA helicase DinG
MSETVWSLIEAATREAFGVPERGRERQVEFAETIAQAIDTASPGVDASGRIVLLQAGTGIGKSRGYCVPLLLTAALQGERSVIATHSHHLMRQLVDQELPAAADLVARSTGKRPTFAPRLGRRNFIDPARAAAVGAHDLAEYAADPANAGTFAEAREEFGLMLPPGVSQEDVCLTVGSGRAAQAAFLRHREAAEAADVVVVPHALLLADARLWGRALVNDNRRQIALIDEADALVTSAENDAVSRVTFARLAALADKIGAGLIGKTDEARKALAGLAGSTYVVKPGDAAVEVVAGLAKAFGAVSVADADVAQEVRELLAELADWQDALDEPGEAAVLEPGALRGWPSLATVTLNPARVLTRLWRPTRDRPAFLRLAVMTSATLSAMTGDPADFSDMFRRMGLQGGRDHYDSHLSSRTFEPSRFGTLRFVLADRAAPVPNRAEEAAAHDAYVADAIRTARDQGGRILVLTTSYDAAQRLAALAPGAVAQERGQKLAGYLDAFKATPGAIFITPAGWEGVDLPGVIDHLVIARLPFGAPDEALDAALIAAANARGVGADAVRGRRIQTAKADARRRLRQGIGRAIRQADDSATVWILDPRFPVSQTAMRSTIRTGITQGPARDHLAMAFAIPNRFGLGAGSAYAKATLHPYKAP